VTKNVRMVSFPKACLVRENYRGRFCRKSRTALSEGWERQTH
jgi:hypothetical protein